MSSKTQQYIDHLNKTQPTAPTEIVPYEVAQPRAVKKEKTMRKQVDLGYDLNQMPVEKQVPFLKQKVAEAEQALKLRTDDVLKLGTAFEIIIAN